MIGEEEQIWKLRNIWKSKHITFLHRYIYLYTFFYVFVSCEWLALYIIYKFHTYFFSFPTTTTLGPPGLLYQDHLPSIFSSCRRHLALYSPLGNTTLSVSPWAISISSLTAHIGLFVCAIYYFFFFIKCQSGMRVWSGLCGTLSSRRPHSS